MRTQSALAALHSARGTSTILPLFHFTSCMGSDFGSRDCLAGKTPNASAPHQRAHLVSFPSLVMNPRRGDEPSPSFWGFAWIAPGRRRDAALATPVPYGAPATPPCHLDSLCSPNVAAVVDCNQLPAGPTRPLGTGEIDGFHAKAIKLLSDSHNPARWQTHQSFWQQARMVSSAGDGILLFLMQFRWVGALICF